MARASYGATSPRATLFMRANDGPGSGRTIPSEPMRNASPRAANQSRTNNAPDHANDGAGDDVARKVRREHHPAQRDDDGIGPQHRPRPRPQRAERHGDGKGVGGMAGRQARIFDGPAEGSVVEGVHAALDQRPGSPDEALDDGDAQARQTRSPGSEIRAASRLRRAARWDMRGSAGEVSTAIAASASASGTIIQTDLPKSVNSIEDCNQPFRHAPRHADGGGVEQQRRRCHDGDHEQRADARDEAGCAISASPRISACAQRTRNTAEHWRAAVAAARPCRRRSLARGPPLTLMTARLSGRPRW